MKKFDAVRLIGLAGMALAGLATLVTSYAQNKQMEETIEEKVNEALAKRESEEESE